MTETVAWEIAKTSILGALLVAACIVIWYLYGRLEAAQKGRTEEVEAVQKARIEDAKAYQTQLIELTKSTTSAVVNGASAMQGQKEALGEVRETFEKFTERMSRRG